MKRSQIILFIVFLFISGLIYIILSNNKKEFNKDIKKEQTTVYVPVRKVKNELRKLTLVSYGQVNPNSEVIVSFEVQGKLEKGDITIKPGTNFRKGQILFRINNEEAFYSLSSRKSALSNIILNAMPDIELDFPAEKNKWIKFLNDLNPGQLMPELPKMNSPKEKMFLTGRNILSEYYNLKSQEARMEKYFYAAPFSGTVVSLFAEPGSIANPGGQIAKIAKTGDFEVKVPISMDDLEMYKEQSKAEFSNSAGELIASGGIIRVSDVINQQTQSADVYYSISPMENQKIYNGMFVNVSINKQTTKETMTLPRASMKNGKVNVLEKGKIIEKDVIVVGSKPDSIYVQGLNNGQQVLLEQLTSDKENIRFEGIPR